MKVKAAEAVARVARVLKVRGREATNEMMAVIAANTMVQVACPVMVFHHLAPTRQCRPMMKTSLGRISTRLEVFTKKLWLTVEDKHDCCCVEGPFLVPEEHLTDVTYIANLGVAHAEFPDQLAWVTKVLLLTKPTM